MFNFFFVFLFFWNTLSFTVGADASYYILELYIICTFWNTLSCTVGTDASYCILCFGGLLKVHFADWSSLLTPTDIGGDFCGEAHSYVQV